MILYGLAGAGKTTQAKLLVARRPGEFEYVGASDCIRRRMAEDPAFAVYAEATTAAGHLIDERELMVCVERRLATMSKSQPLIFDGVTRTRYQAEAAVRLLKARGLDKIVTIHLRVPEAVAFERMRKQQVEQKRSDGSEAAMVERLQQYRDHSAAILEVLGRLTRLININGDQSREKVFAEITLALKEI